MNAKTCSTCRVTKPANEYNRASRRNGSGLYAYCKPCASTRDAARYAANPGKVIERVTARARGIVVVEHVNRSVVYARDGGRCQLCGWGPVDPARFDLDHVLPVSKGGVHSYANIQLTHPWCNDSKGAKNV